MRYIKPNYEKETVSTNDIILASLTEGGAILTEVNASTAQVGASALDILGLR